MPPHRKVRALAVSSGSGCHWVTCSCASGSCAGFVRGLPLASWAGADRRWPAGPGAEMSDGPPGEQPGSVDELRGPTVLRMILGTQLRRLREAADVTPDEAGYEIRASRSKISRMENGRVGFKERDVADLLTLYGITDEEKRAGLLSLARQANTQGWWSNYSDVLAD